MFTTLFALVRFQELINEMPLVMFDCFFNTCFEYLWNDKYNKPMIDVETMQPGHAAVLTCEEDLLQFLAECGIDAEAFRAGLVKIDNSQYKLAAGKQ